MNDLRGGVAVITGASQGLGLHIARALGAAGMRVVLAARGEEKLTAAVIALEAEGVEALAVPTDVLDARARAALLARAEQHFGPIDVLVNNAGVDDAAALERHPEGEIERMIALNLTAPMLLTRAVLPGMLERNRGHILNVCSTAGLNPVGHGATYSASKHGIFGFSRSLRATSLQSGHAVSASALCPGYVAGEGMYARRNAEHGVASPAALGTTSPEAVAIAALRAIREDLPYVIVNPGPARLSFALGFVLPRFGEWLALRMGAWDVFKAAADARDTGR